MTEKAKRTFQQSSPLETLVRRASSRRTKQAPSSPANNNPFGPSDQQVLLNPSFNYTNRQQQPQPGLSVNLTTPPRNHSFALPPSPLLHSHFRSSVATTSSYDQSFQRESITQPDDLSIYSDDHNSPELLDNTRHSWQSTDSNSTATPGSALTLSNRSDSTPAVIVSAPESEPNSQYGVVHPDFHTTSSGFARTNFPHHPTLQNLSGPSKSPIYAQNALSPSPSSSSSYQLPNLSPTSPLLPTGFLRPPSSESPSSPHSYRRLGETNQPPVVSSGSDQAINLGALSVGSEHLFSPSLQLQTPQDYLQLGIQHHEANRLDQAAICFEKSAKEQGGCGVGMLMFGLTLRHGWGCPKNEKNGLHWLQKAAESAVNDLESDIPGVDATAVQGELVIAIYEVGQSFLQGWGVKKDKKMAVSYFQVAARLGDPDAQQSLAFCLANGKGCKKNRKEAAKWYRAAVAQGGISDVGLAWIYKEKYQ